MWFKIQKQKVFLHIFAKPNAKNSKLLKIDSDYLHIALHAKPEDGEANKELISYLAKLLQIPKSHLVFQRGEKSKYKVISVSLCDKVKKFIDHAADFLEQKL